MLPFMALPKILSAYQQTRFPAICHSLLIAQIYHALHFV
jgi:hypothetical protein